MTHIVWDWNGTLFDDIDAVFVTTNEILGPYGHPPLDVAGFRAGYTRPIWLFYEKLLGRPLVDGEWRRLDDSFHTVYRTHMRRCRLTDGAETLLRDWQATGRTQSLLSMWNHDELVGKLAELGLADRFTRVDGSRAGNGGPKAERLVEHLDALGVPPADVLLIGDSVDDAHAAAHVGARAVLYTGGCHARAQLEAVGVPVTDRLADALAHAAPRTGGT